MAVEKIKAGGQTYTRSYTTDALGNITAISDNTFGSHTYEYDYRGFLTKADNEVYEYDGNGNITKKGNKIFVYDNLIKDRLISVGGVAISYDSNNPLNPTQFGNENYTFEGRRLTRLSLPNAHYDYKYNNQGLRIQKIKNDVTTLDYTYDGDKLVCEKSPYHGLDFLYDENDILYGFIKDNIEKYLYIRNNLKNIIGITTLFGEIVEKYTYSAWSEVISTTGTLASTIGTLDPFKYKGYYYDEESELFIMGYRYYSPELCRFILPAEAFDLNPYSINSLNLNAYANNNPVRLVYRGIFSM